MRGMFWCEVEFVEIEIVEKDEWKGWMLGGWRRQWDNLPWETILTYPIKSDYIQQKLHLVWSYRFRLIDPYQTQPIKRFPPIIVSRKHSHFSYIESLFNEFMYTQKFQVKRNHYLTFFPHISSFFFWFFHFIFKD